MNKKYQVFISSTYIDLKEERQAAINATLNRMFIPAGMEQFPASPEEQFEYIKPIIDDSDFYVLIIGGRYGSVDEKGVSYTEKEFDYAVFKKKHILSFLHDDPGIIPSRFVDLDEEKRERLKEFREKIKTGRLVHYWTSPEELENKIRHSLMEAVHSYNPIGWVRGESVVARKVQKDLNKSKREIIKLNKEIEELKSKQVELYKLYLLPEIRDKFEVRTNVSQIDEDGHYKHMGAFIIKTSILKLVENYNKLLLSTPSDMQFFNALKNDIGTHLGFKDQDIKRINGNDEHNIRELFLKFGIISLEFGEYPDCFWQLTQPGKELIEDILKYNLDSKKAEAELTGNVSPTNQKWFFPK